MNFKSLINANSILHSGVVWFLIPGLLSFIPLPAAAQNIVKNPGFENYSALPSYYGEWFKCDDWSNVNGVEMFLYPYASPDYLHTSGTGGAGLPFCTFATVDPYEGEAIMGFITYLNYEPEFREYISVQFTDPMVPGTTYTVTFQITSGVDPMNGMGSDHIGVMFSVGPLSQMEHEPIGGTPQFEIPGMFFNNDWQTFTYTFTADDSYDYITFGNFYDDGSTDAEYFDFGGIGGAYYFVDGVSVIPEGVVTVVIDTAICEGSVYMLPGGDFTDTAGTYIDSLVTAGGLDSIVITNLDVVPAYFISVSASVCEGTDYVLPDGSFVNVTGVYTTVLSGVAGCDSTIITTLSVLPFISTVIDTSICEGNEYILPDGTITDAAGTYSFTFISAGGCDSIVQINLDLIPLSVTEQDISLCAGVIYELPDGTVVSEPGIYTSVLLASTGCDSTVITTISYVDQYEVTVDTSIIEGQAYELPDGTTVSEEGTYYTVVTSTGGCDSLITTIITFIILTPDVVVPNAFSPNGDGLNDVYHVFADGIVIESFVIYNRWGQVIYTMLNGEVEWDGTFNGFEQEMGTYIYMMEFTDEKGVQTKSGTIVLIR